MSNHEFPELLPTLKRLLKDKGISYRALARHLEISESSVKKLFIADDCPLSRLNKICELLEVKLSDLLAENTHRELGQMQFTEAQEAFLTGNRKAFQIYWKLVYEEWELNRIAGHFGLSEAALFKILRALDHHQLLELLPDGKVKVPELEMVLWIGDGPLLKMVREEWSPLMMRKIAEKAAEGDSRYNVALRMYSLRPKTAEEFKRAFAELQLEFSRRSAREEKLHRKDTQLMFMVSAFSPESFVEHL